MSDLISRSKLLKEIKTWGGCVEALHEYIQNMPTAYDIDKIIKELELHSFELGTDTLPVHYIRLNEAIKIVKQGDVSDDVCECRKLKDYRSLFKTSCGYIFAREGFKYCPYCGKKILCKE